MRRILTTSAILLGLALRPADARRRARLDADAADQDDLPVPGRRRHRPDRADRRQGLTDRLGQQVYVENRGGANGGLGAQEVMRAEPDGYTIGAISDSPMTVNPWLYDKLPYSPLQGLHRGRADQPLPVAAGRAPLGPGSRPSPT